MTSEQILKKAIKEAVKNGWEFGNYFLEELFGKGGEWEMYDLEETLKAGYGKTIWFIFSHDFAKAFWGETEYETTPLSENRYLKKLGWKEHLQQMVLEEEPILYLEKFL